MFRYDGSFITSAKEVMFSLHLFVFVCMFVSRITQRMHNRLSHITADLGPMYATDRQTSDRRQTDRCQTRIIA